jgi:perosamine synthetase
MGAEIESRDVSSESWCLELEELSDISEAKDAVVLVLVHTLGNSSNLEHASRFKRNQNIIIIEDAAEAYMSKSGDDYLGTIFDIGTYSMHAAKTITTGEGGFLSSNRLELNEPLELLRNHGMSPTRPYFHELPGSNFRLSNLLASLAHPQLDAIEQLLLERTNI